MSVRPGDLRDTMVRAARLTRGTLTVRRAPTARQAEVLEKLRQYRAVTGEDMPLRVLARSLAMSPKGAQHHLEALEAKGYQTRSAP